MQKSVWKSKKFWATVGACLAAIGSAYLGMEASTIELLVQSLSAYVIGQGIADAGKNKV